MAYSRRRARPHRFRPQFRLELTSWHAKQFSYATSAARKSTRRKGAVMRVTYSDARRMGSRPISATSAPARCRASPPPAAAASRSRPTAAPRRRAAAAFPALCGDARTAHGDVRTPLYHGAVPLSLIAGPANAGKVELLLDRYLDVARRASRCSSCRTGRTSTRVERELLARRPALSSPGRSAHSTTSSSASRRPAARPRPLRRRAARVRRPPRDRRRGAERARRVGAVAAASPTRSLETIAEVESACSSPDDLDGDARRALRGVPRGARPRSALVDRELLRRIAVERLQSDLDAWHGEPVFAYGFEDLTGAQWALLEALAGAHGRQRVAAVRAGRARRSRRCGAPPRISRVSPAARIEELPPRYARVARIPRSRISSARSSPTRRRRRSRSTARFASSRAPARAARSSSSARSCSRSCAPARRPSRSASSARASSAGGRRSRRRSATLGVPYAVDGEVRLAQTPFGQALAAMLRFAWLGGTRRDLFTFLRSPFSGLERRAVDFVEGRLRGRAIQTPERVVEESEKLRGAPLPALAELRDADDPGRRPCASSRRGCCATRYGLDAPAGRRVVAARPARVRDA